MKLAAHSETRLGYREIQALSGLWPAVQRHQSPDKISRTESGRARVYRKFRLQALARLAGHRDTGRRRLRHRYPRQVDQWLRSLHAKPGTPLRV